jgi:molybdate transport system ATP-binding protein
MPVLYVSHAADEVARLADHLVLLDAGRVRASGPLADLRARLDLASGAGGEADAIIECRVAAHDAIFHLTYLEFAGGRLSVPRHDLPIGHAVRLRVLARDVSITLERQTATSILNIFPAVVDDLVDESAAQMLVRLSVAGTPVLARITRKSANALALARGRQAYVQVKAVALLA